MVLDAKTAANYQQAKSYFSSFGYQVETKNGQCFVKIGEHKIPVDEKDTIWDLNVKLEKFCAASYAQEKKDNLIASLDSQVTKIKEEADKYLNKQKVENEKYELAREAYKEAMKGKSNIVSQTGCNSAGEIAEYDKNNGTNFFEKFMGYITDIGSANSARRMAESMSNFYGNMALDSRSFANDISNIKTIAQHTIPDSIFNLS